MRRKLPWLSPRFAGAVVVTAGVLLSGCAQSAEQAAESVIESQLNGDVEISDDSFTFESESDGIRVEGGVGTELPDNFPADVPSPPGATVMSTAQTPDGVSVTWNWEGLTVDEFDRYVESIKAAGYRDEVTTTSMDLGNGEFTRGAVLSGKGTTVAVTAFVADESAGMTIVVTPDSP
jgi:hypothetical protein